MSVSRGSFHNPPSEALEKIASLLKADSRIHAAWLEGSFGRGVEDRYSDIDLHILSPEVEEIELYAMKLLSKVSKPVLSLGLKGADGKVLLVHSLLQDGVRVDVVLHEKFTSPLRKGGCRILLDRHAALKLEEIPFPELDIDELTAKLKEFWRLIAMLPVVLGRGEMLVASVGLSREVELAAEVVSRCHFGPRASGVKRLNSFLPSDVRRELEEVVTHSDLSIRGMARAQLAVARIVQREGRRYAAQLHFEYPVEVEEVALAYVERELSLLGIDMNEVWEF